MKPPQFDYLAPTTVDEVLAALAESPETTTLLAGGQSLVPLLNMRLARPERIIDLNRVAELDMIEEHEDTLHVDLTKSPIPVFTFGPKKFDVHLETLYLGAMTRQHAVETNAMIRKRAPMLTEAVQYIAHLAIRTRGTIGGSLAHADPAAELPAVMLALAAHFFIRNASGKERFVTANRFFVGPLTTAIQPGELLTRIQVGFPDPRAGTAFVEVARTHGAFALVGAAALVRLDDSRRIEHIRLALCGVGSTPYEPEWLMNLSVEEAPDDSTFGAIAARVAAEIDPPDDIHATSAYRRTVAGVVTRRALHLAASRAA